MTLSFHHDIFVLQSSVSAMNAGDNAARSLPEPGAGRLILALLLPDVLTGMV